MEITVRMNAPLERIKAHVIAINDLVLIIYMTLGSYLVQLPVIAIIILIAGESVEMGSSISPIQHWSEAVLFDVVIGPIIETFLFQYVIIVSLLRIRKLALQRVLICLISASAFAAAHFYSLFYIMTVFPVGLLLAYTFLLRLPSYKRAFWVVVAVHALRNTGALLTNWFFN